MHLGAQEARTWLTICFYLNELLYVINLISEINEPIKTYNDPSSRSQKWYAVLLPEYLVADLDLY